MARAAVGEMYAFPRIFLFLFACAYGSRSEQQVILQTVTDDGTMVVLRGGDDPCRVLHDLCCKGGLPQGADENSACVSSIQPLLTRLLTAAWRHFSNKLTVYPSLFLECKDLDTDRRLHYDNVTQSSAPTEKVTRELLDVLRGEGDRDGAAREFDERRNDLRMTAEEQVELYRQAIMLEPSHPLVVGQFGVALLATGREDLARALFADAVRRRMWPNVMQRPVSYFVPGLASKPWHDPRKFAFTEVLERGFEDIRRELLAAEDTLFYVEAENRNSYNVGGSWKTLVVKEDRNSYTDLARKHFPATLEWLERCEEEFLLVKFSALDPGTVIHPHTGPSNERLRSHFTLVHGGGARLRVGGEWRAWEEGKVIVFDSSWEHEVVHEGSGRRIVLILDVWHPQYISAYSDGH